MKQIVQVMPFYEPRMWGGSERLIKEYHYVTDIAPIGEVFNVIALPNQADCPIPQLDTTLSQLYIDRPDWFCCDTEQLPIRVNFLDPSDRLSIQIHPNDEFAKRYNGGRGKPEAWVIVDTIEGGEIEFGHQAKTREEFIEKTNNHDWEHLLKYLKVVKDGFIDIPSGTLHAVGKGVLTYNIARNADCTLRLYDYDRIDPKTGNKRPIHPKEVFENVNIPDTSTGFVVYPAAHELGVDVTRYWDEPGRYTLMRLQVAEQGRFRHDRFAFYTCVDGEGTINDTPIRKGETVLVPDGYGWLTLHGHMDLFLASYRNEK